MGLLVSDWRHDIESSRTKSLDGVQFLTLQGFYTWRRPKGKPYLGCTVVAPVMVFSLNSLYTVLFIKRDNELYLLLNSEGSLSLDATINNCHKELPLRYVRWFLIGRCLLFKSVLELDIN